LRKINASAIAFQASPQDDRCGAGVVRDRLASRNAAASHTGTRTVTPSVDEAHRTASVRVGFLPCLHHESERLSPLLLTVGVLRVPIELDGRTFSEN
jgi:hypothetical protein